MLEGQIPHPAPERLICLNDVKCEHYLALAVSDEKNGSGWINAQVAVNHFADMITDETLNANSRFFAQRCADNLA